MTGKILTVVPLLVLSGLFFAAGITDGGILFVVFAGAVFLAFLRAGRRGRWPGPEEASEIEVHGTTVPGSRRGPGAGGAA